MTNESDLQRDDFYGVMSEALNQGSGNLEIERSLKALLDENARLRKLAIQLSNMLGDLPS